MITTQPQSSLASYSELKRRVREAFARGRERAEAAVEREKVRTSWEVGKLVLEHTLLNKERADYGKQVVKRLSADLAISTTELYHMLEFARAYPIFAHARKLAWSDYRDLLAVNDESKRKALIDEASRQGWKRDTIRREIKKIKATDPGGVAEAPAEEPLVPVKGILNTYRIVAAEAGEWQAKPVIDLGFADYHRPSGGFPFNAGDIVQILGEEKITRLKEATEADIFTYKAHPLDITDGDTLWLWIDLGFGFFTKQHVRLRGIDAPEITTRDGQLAKKFVESRLKKVSSILITSTKSDKYDRYLADIFYETKQGEQFLNNRLLQEELAVRID